MSTKKIKFTIGADPEILLAKSGKPISAIGKIGGSKLFPKRWGEREGFARLEDNVAAEYTIPPANNKKAFVHAVIAGKQHISHLVEPMGIKVSRKTSMHYPPEDLDHPRAREFGCDPDWCAWTGRRNPPPDSGGRLRSAGGHVHLGFNQAELDAIDVVKALDLTLGVPSVLIDTDSERRKLYGNAGSFRRKDYGVEYRVLSAFWIHKKKLIEWVHDNAHLALQFVATGAPIGNQVGDKIRTAINKNDKKLADELCFQFEIPLP